MDQAHLQVLLQKLIRAPGKLDWDFTIQLRNTLSHLVRVIMMNLVPLEVFIYQGMYSLNSIMEMGRA